MQNNAVTDKLVPYKTNGQCDNLQEVPCAKNCLSAHIQYINGRLSIASSISIIIRRLQFIVSLCICAATNYI